MLESMHKEAFLGAAMQGVRSLGTQALYRGRAALRGMGMMKQPSIINMAPHNAVVPYQAAQGLARTPGHAGAAAGGNPSSWGQRAGNWMRNNPKTTMAGAFGGTALAGGMIGRATAPNQRQDPYGRTSYASAQGEPPVINLDKFLSPEASVTLKTAGLHRIMAAMEKVAHGRDVGPEITFPIAVQLLSERAFTKRAEFRQIQNGLRALRTLRGE